MTHIHIEKSVAGNIKQHIRVPLVAIRALSKVLPHSAIEQLKATGIDLNAILQAIKTGNHYSETIHVIENGVEKSILISLNNKNLET